jgi:hypothetical protein
VLVYGDHLERADPQERLQDLGQRLGQIAATPGGIARHGKLVGALVEAGQLLQGVADEGWPAGQLNDFLYGLAAAVVRSWDSRFSALGDLPSAPRIELPPTVELRLPEGFAFYAVYPEAYVDAARRLRLSGVPRVIGIRSIGTTLGAVVAAELGAPPPITVRPFGDPFAREVHLPTDAIDPHAHYVIVDEGPGLSGSSFGCVADALETAGVPAERIAFLPSHGGDLGPQASEAHRKRWAKAQRVAAELDTGWLTDLFGPLHEIPATDHSQRRKFLGWRSGERVLIKFAGLGAIGERKLEMARALHSAGFTPEPIEFAHGFLIERWYGDAQPLAPGAKPVEEIGRYLGARALLFAADETSGAGIAELLTMCRRNISLAFGDHACSELERFDANALQKRVRRVRTDNKLDRDEWLRMPGGRLLKADALDHHQGHDLLGCQDLAWDIAGAAAEFELQSVETRNLTAASGWDVDPDLLEFCRIAYASFRFGWAELTGQAGEVDRYGRSLQNLLHQHVRPETRQESLVD